MDSVKIEWYAVVVPPAPHEMSATITTIASSLSDRCLRENDRKKMQELRLVLQMVVRSQIQSGIKNQELIQGVASQVLSLNNPIGFNIYYLVDLYK